MKKKMLLEEDGKIEKGFKCGICEKVMAEPFSLIPCNHNYCKKCIEESWKKSNKCPFCKADIVAK
jgi:late competence protein required for DNA uptake (superfamily II DNA/RNA helicase)